MLRVGKHGFSIGFKSGVVATAALLRAKNVSKIVLIELVLMFV